MRAPIVSTRFSGWPERKGLAFIRYLVIVEKGRDSYGAHVPDLPGCIAAAVSKEEVLQPIREAIEFHLECLKQDGIPAFASSP